MARRVDMEGQSITLKIDGKEYPLRVQNAETEQLMRIAAENINAMLAKYDEKFPDKTLVDKLAFVTLNEAVSRLSAQRKLAKANEGIESLDQQLSDYLGNIEKNR